MIICSLNEIHLCKPVVICINNQPHVKNLLHIEIQESKEDMADKDFTDRFSKHTALVLRLTKMLHGKGHRLRQRRKPVVASYYYGLLDLG